MSAVFGLLLLAETCFSARVTGYSRYEHGSHTADGTPILTDEPIVAAGPELAFDTLVEIDGLGTYRVADRGSGVGYRHLDVAVWSRAEAFSITSVRRVCLVGGP